MEEHNFGKWLRELRQKLNFTQEELAQRLDVSNRTVQRWESMRTKPRNTLIERLVHLGRRHGIIVDPRQLRLF